MSSPDLGKHERYLVDTLKPVDGWSRVGEGEKDVKKMTDGVNCYARKVYRYRRSMDNTERSRRAQWEWDSLQFLNQQDYARRHITAPVEQIYDQGQPVGLLTSWREGIELNYSEQLAIPRGAFARLQNMFDELLDVGQYIRPDDLHGVFWDGKDLWFPECRIFNAQTYFPPTSMPTEWWLRWFPGEYSQLMASLKGCYQK